MDKIERIAGPAVAMPPPTATITSGMAPPTRFAALDVATGRVIGTCKPRHRAQEFIAFLETIAAATPPQLTLHLIADNYAISSAANSTAVQPWRTPS